MKHDIDLETRENQASSLTKKGLLANLSLTVLKFIAGLMGHSAAMVADAFHSLSDLLSDFIVLAGFKLSVRPADKTHQYGHGKIETFIALVIGSILFFVGIGIIVSALIIMKKIINGSELKIPGLVALLMAAISIVVKEVLFRKSIKLAKNLDSPVLVANAWHHRSDALSSVAAFLGIAGAHFMGPNWRILDPLAALIVALLIIKLSFSVILGSLNDLLEASLSKGENQEIEQIIASTKGVLDVHGMRTRRLGPCKAIEAHVCVDCKLNVVEAHDIATDVENAIKETFGSATHVAIHIEPADYKD